MNKSNILIQTLFLLLITVFSGCSSKFAVKVYLHDGNPQLVETVGESKVIAERWQILFLTMMRLDGQIGANSENLIKNIITPIAKQHFDGLEPNSNEKYEDILNFWTDYFKSNVFKEISGWTTFKEVKPHIDELTTLSDYLYEQYISNDLEIVDFEKDPKVIYADSRISSLRIELQYIYSKNSMILENIINLDDYLVQLLNDSGISGQSIKNYLKTIKDTQSTIIQSIQLEAEKTNNDLNLKENQSSLTDFKVSRNLGDKHLRKVLTESKRDWKLYHEVEAHADGTADFVFIQDTLGNFRIKKMFNDPTDVYNAGANIALKVVEIGSTLAGGMSGLPIGSIQSPNSGLGVNGQQQSTLMQQFQTEINNAQSEIRKKQILQSQINKELFAMIEELEGIDVSTIGNSTDLIANQKTKIDAIYSMIKPNSEESE